MTVSLTSSFMWAGGHETVELVYDVVVNTEDWIVLGKKKGYYVADVSRITPAPPRSSCPSPSVQQSYIC
jgi:hypothetical protein